MKVKEAIEKAVYQGNYELAGKIADLLRFKYKLNYDEVYEIFIKGYDIGYNWKDFIPGLI